MSSTLLQGGISTNQYNPAASYGGYYVPSSYSYSSSPTPIATTPITSTGGSFGGGINFGNTGGTALAPTPAPQPMTSLLPTSTAPLAPTLTGGLSTTYVAPAPAPVPTVVSPIANATANATTSPTTLNVSIPGPTQSAPVTQAPVKGGYLPGVLPGLLATLMQNSPFNPPGVPAINPGGLPSPPTLNPLTGAPMIPSVQTSGGPTGAVAPPSGGQTMPLPLLMGGAGGMAPQSQQQSTPIAPGAILSGAEGGGGPGQAPGGPGFNRAMAGGPPAGAMLGARPSGAQQTLASPGMGGAMAMGRNAGDRVPLSAQSQKAMADYGRVVPMGGGGQPAPGSAQLAAHTPSIAPLEGERHESSGPGDFPQSITPQQREPMQLTPGYQGEQFGHRQMRYNPQTGEATGTAEASPDAVGQAMHNAVVQMASEMGPKAAEIASKMAQQEDEAERAAHDELQYPVDIATGKVNYWSGRIARAADAANAFASGQVDYDKLYEAARQHAMQMYPDEQKQPLPQQRQSLGEYLGFIPRAGIHERNYGADEWRKAQYEDQKDTRNKRDKAAQDFVSRYLNAPMKDWQQSQGMMREAKSELDMWLKRQAAAGKEARIQVTGQIKAQLEALKIQGTAASKINTAAGAEERRAGQKANTAIAQQNANTGKQRANTGSTREARIGGNNGLYQDDKKADIAQKKARTDYIKAKTATVGGAGAEPRGENGMQPAPTPAGFDGKKLKEALKSSGMPPDQAVAVYKKMMGLE